MMALGVKAKGEGGEGTEATLAARLAGSDKEGSL